MGELLQKLGHERLESRPVIGKSMKMYDLLTEPPPECFNRIRPGGIGREHQEFDGKPFVLRPGFSRHGRPIRGERTRKRQRLGHQAGQYIWMQMNRPIILRHIDERGFVGIGGADLLVKTA